MIYSINNFHVKIESIDVVDIDSRFIVVNGIEKHLFFATEEHIEDLVNEWKKHHAN